MSLDGSKLPVYFQSFRRMAIAFSTIFKNVWLVRTDTDGNQVYKAKVALDYGPAMAWYDRLKARGTITDDTGPGMIENMLPRMSFEMGDPTYDSTRQRNTMNNQTKFSAIGQNAAQLSPAPYNVPFTLRVLGKNIDDCLMIVEQILPMFQPQMNLKIKEVDQLNIYNDVLIVLESVSHEDNYLEGFNDNRLVTWTLQFMIKGNIYPPFGDTSGVIYKAIINMVDLDYGNDVFSTPTLAVVTATANQINPPDYDPDNSTITIAETPLGETK